MSNTECRKIQSKKCMPPRDQSQTYNFPVSLQSMHVERPRLAVCQEKRPATCSPGIFVQDDNLYELQQRQFASDAGHEVASNILSFF